MAAGRADKGGLGLDHHGMLSLHVDQQIEETGEGEVVVLDHFRRSRQTGQRASSPAVRVVIADGRALVRAGFRVLLEAGRIAVTGEAGNGDEAVALARGTLADVVLLDANLGGVEGTCRTLSGSGVAVMLLTESEDDEHLLAALRAGASGVLAKDARPAELLRAVRLVASGEAIVSPVFTRRLITELRVS
jgi:DNA-binding NarL/FixJ family response regulator